MKFNFIRYSSIGNQSCALQDRKGRLHPTVDSTETETL